MFLVNYHIYEHTAACAKVELQRKVYVEYPEGLVYFEPPKNGTWQLPRSGLVLLVEIDNDT
jgi:hypothetical protein